MVGASASGALPVLIPGRIDTVAGTDQWPYGGDNIAATSASVWTPQGIVLDAAGNLYLSDTGNNRIRRVDVQSGAITTVAGNGIQGFSGDGGLATAASIGSPAGLAMDGAGDLYLADVQNSVIRRVDALTHTISTIAGTPQTSGYSGDGGAATQAQLSLPRGISIENDGNLLIADTGNNSIRRLDASTGIISTIAGDGTAGYTGDGQLAGTARLSGPSATLSLSDGSLLIADTDNNRIRRIDASGVINTVVGTGAQGFTGDNGSAVQATLHRPIGLTIDPVGNLYIADSGNNRVRVVDATSGNISTLVGTDSEGFTGDGGPANLASLYGPFDVRFTQSGDLYLTDMFHMRVRRVSGSILRISYPTIRRGKVSSPKLQTMANYGNAPLQLSMPQYVYSALDSATTTCSTTATLAPAASCVLGVEFAPTVIGNDVVGSLTLPSNATNMNPVITVDGQVLDVNPTSIALVSSANPSVVGAQITLTGTVTSDDHGRTGNVTFTSDGATLCTVALGADGTAACSTSTLSLGSHNVVAQYAGDPQNAAATSATLVQVVKQQTTLALTSSANPVVVTNSLMFTVLATAVSGTPTGSATFIDGTTTLGTVNLANGQASFTTSILTVGSHAITVQYSGDASDAAGTSPVLTQTVQQATSTTTLATSSATVVVGSSLTLTATVSSNNGPAPTGSVRFAEGATTYGTAPLQGNGSASVTFTNLPPGTHALVATFSGDTDNSTSASAPLTETVQQIGTTTTLTPSINPLAAGATLHLSAQVGMAQGATAYGALNGQVVFADGAQALATVQLDGNDVAIFDVHGLAVGTHSLTATYQGSFSYAQSAGTVNEVVTQTATTVTVSSAASPTLAGKPATFTAAVISTTGIPTGFVTLRDGGRNLGSAPLNAQGVASLVTSSLAVGTHSVTATYNGDSNYIVSISAPIVQQVNLAATSAALDGPTAAVNVTATAVFRSVLSSPGVTPSGTLTLQEGAITIAAQPVSNVGVYSFAVSSLGLGQHTLTVAYSGDANNAPALSPAFMVTVQQAPSTTTVTGSGSPSTLGNSVTFSAAVVSPTANLSGLVRFMDGARLLASVPLNNGAAVFSTSSLQFGAHAVTAVYSGDSNHASSTSAPLPEAIVQQAAVTLSSDLNPSNSGQLVTITAVLAAVGGNTPTGSVTFMDNGAGLGAFAVDSTGAARVRTAALSVGNHTIVAVYAGDLNFSGASASTAQLVKNAATTTTAAVSADPGTYGAPLTLSANVGSNGGGATGTVVFLENGTAVGSAPLNAAGAAALTLSTLSPGRHTVSASYLGDGKASPSSSGTVSFLVRQRTTLNLASNANPALTLNGIVITATLANNNAAVAIGSVVFREGATVLGTMPLDANGTATLMLAPLANGTHSIAATYAGDDRDFPANAAPLMQVVQQRSTSTLLTSSATDAADAQQVTLIAVVQSPVGVATSLPSGTVTFSNGSTVVGSARIDAAGVATLTIRLQTGASQTLTATYDGDASYAPSTSGKDVVSSGTAPQFILAMSNQNVVVKTGDRVVVNVTVASVKGFNDMLKFGCAGLPYATTCTFSQTATQLAAGGSGSLQLTIDTGNPLGEGTAASASASAVRRLANHGAALCVLPAAFLLCFPRRRRLQLLAMLILCAATLGITGCAGLTKSSTPPGSYTFQVTALGQGTGATEAQTVTLKVTQ